MGTKSTSILEVGNTVGTLAAALGTFFAVIVALFGDWLRARLLPIKLRIELNNPIGTFIHPPGRIAENDYDTEDYWIMQRFRI